MPEYRWPEMSKRKVMGRRFSRLDGVEKASGRAKYTSDLNKPGMLHAVLVTSPHAHAKVKAIDTSAAEKHPGVAAVRVIAPAGTEIDRFGLPQCSGRMEKIRNYRAFRLYFIFSFQKPGLLR